jgi:2-polyprenyl-6-methoxyphenol hydroxylase-like FAD-dependent oxidoreductase
MNSEFAACLGKSARMKCLRLMVARGYETSKRQRPSSYLYCHHDGVALVGDAAATTDPTYGQGCRLRCVLRDELTKNSDWDAAGHLYAEEHRRSFHACHLVEGWFRRLFQDPSVEAAALRARAMPLIAEDPTRVPGHIFSGPDLPLNEQVRARLFGEC